MKPITLKENLYPRDAEIMARKMIRESLDEKETYHIIIDQPTVTDYFVYEKGKLRRCIDKEWSNYIDNKYPIKQ